MPKNEGVVRFGVSVWRDSLDFDSTFSRVSFLFAR